MGAHVGLLPDRTPLWRLFPLPGTTTRRLSPQKHPPPDPPCRPDGAEGFRLASSQNTASSNCGLAQGRKEDGPGLAEAHGLNSTTTESACLRRSSCRLLILARERQTGGGPARCRTEPCTISGSEDKPTLHSLEASKDAVIITLTDTTSGHRHFPRGFYFRYRTQKRPTTQSVVREILVVRTK